MIETARSTGWVARSLSLTTVCFGVLAGLSGGLAAQTPESEQSAITRMSEPGPEATALARSAGSWDVVFTIWPEPGAAPRIMRRLIAERTMVGPFLQEIMRPAPGSGLPDFRRIDYLGFDRVEGRWKYVSLDTRFPVGIMPAWSFDAQRADSIALTFEALAFPGFGTEVEGRLTRSDLIIIRQDTRRELKRQHFVRSDGTGRVWLAVQYEYSRRR